MNDPAQPPFLPDRLELREGFDAQHHPDERPDEHDHGDRPRPDLEKLRQQELEAGVPVPPPKQPAKRRPAEAREPPEPVEVTEHIPTEQGEEVEHEPLAFSH